MKTAWILISNSEYAQIFLLKNKQLTLLHELEHQESKQKVLELVSDHEGRGQSFGWNQQYPLNQGEEIKVHEREKFVSELFHFCKQHFDAHQFEKLIIFAAPKTLGDIRRIFEPILAHCSSQEIDKELPSYWTIHEKAKYLSNFLDIPLERPKKNP
jgi:protein required for attachment to host cells